MVEIMVFGGVFVILMFIFIFWYGYKEIIYDIVFYVISISYSDSIKNELDVIVIVLEDSVGCWVNEWYLRKGDMLVLCLGYQGEDLFDCGIYVIDKIDISVLFLMVNIDGIVILVSKVLCIKNSQGFEEMMFFVIVSCIV